MKTYSRFWFASLPLGMLLTAATLAHGQDPAAANKTTDDQQLAYKNAIAQDTLRKDTVQIQEQLIELANELKANGLDGGDLKVLTDAADHLSTLSQEDMQKVIDSLRSASMSSDQAERLRDLVIAYQQQKQVQMGLKTVAVNITASESPKEIPARLEVLIARQATNVRQTSNLKPNPSGDQQKSLHDVVSAEQNSIGGEIDILFKVLATAPPPPADDGTTPDGTAPAPDLAKAALTSLNASPIKEATQSAGQLTANGPFPEAVTSQKTIRDSLTQALTAAMAGYDVLTQLQEIKAQLDQLISDQKDLKEVSRQSRLDGSLLAERQARINDRSSIAQALIKPINPPASDQVTTAQQDMEQSSRALESAKNTTDIAAKQDQVVTDLEKVEALLDKQIADIEDKQNETPEQKVADLEKLKADLEAEKADPKTTKDQLDKTQADAAPLAPPAASDIAAAAAQLPNKAAANPDIDQAIADVDKTLDQEKQAAAQVAALDKASTDIAAAQADAKAAAAAATAADPTTAARDNSQAQAATAAAAAAAQAAGAPPGAAPALADAQADEKTAEGNDVKGDPADGAKADAQAQDALAKAADAVAAAKADAEGQGQGKGQGKGQGQGQGKGQGQGQGTGNGPPKDLAKQGTGQGNGAAKAPNSVTSVLARSGLGWGPGQIMGGLKPRDRDAINQYQAEKSPPEYAPLVQQYLKNLADSGNESQ